VLSVNTVLLYENLKDITIVLILIVVVYFTRMFKDYKFWNNKVIIDHGFKINGLLSLCWVWNGATDKDGYGVTSYNGKYMRTHILSLKLTSIIYNPSLPTLHKCNIKGCYHPEHLYQGDTSQNAKDSVKAGTHFHARQTHCKYGHEFNDKNTKYHTSKKGKYQRICLICMTMRNNQRGK
jgi:hypothetical protein